MKYAETVSGRPFTKDPAVVKFAGEYYMYYSLPGETAEGSWRIGIARSNDLENFAPVGHLTPEAKCERNGLCAPGAIVLNGQVHMFYQTYGNGKRDAICHAWSDDGVNFTRDPSNPVFSPTGDWNCGRAIDADVIEFKGELIMYFATRDPDMRAAATAAARGSSAVQPAYSRLNCPGSRSALKPPPPAYTAVACTCSMAAPTTTTPSR